jgi:hypothetical protein
MTYQYDAEGSRVKADDGNAAKWYLIDKQFPYINMFHVSYQCPIKL